MALTLISPRALDRFQAKLPPVAKQLFGLQRTMIGTVWSGIGVFSGRARTSVGETTDAGATRAKTVAGQAEHAVRATAADARDEAIDLADQATTTFDAAADAALDTFTKAELYEIAQERDIDGRSSMSKQELIDALQG